MTPRGPETVTKSKSGQSLPSGAAGEGPQNPTIHLDIPHALSHGGSYAIWKPGGPGRLLSQLARDHSCGEATLTPDQLADLVQLFRDEPLPESLREAVAQHLRGKRVRSAGAPRKRETACAQIESIMLPGIYAEASKDAKIERVRLRKLGRKQGRYDNPDRLPTTSAIACYLVRTWLPTLAGLDDRSLQNLVSKSKARLADDGEDQPAPLPRRPLKRRC